ncbi:MAG: threonine synthase [Eubacteriales bacterium]|nr:threonine synthase [Eubacteriales bacterium]
MKYISTRGGMFPVTSAEAIRRGIAPDGGLFVPDELFKIPYDDIVSMVDMDYRQRARKILSGFLNDFSDSEIEYFILMAYNSDNFDSVKIAPLRILTSQLFIQELWHGPTSAFKDIALQFLPQVMVKASEKAGENLETIILTATSGDTGKAALEGFKDVIGTRIIVFYPENGVSEIQKMQMLTQEGSNVYVIGVKGNFDDTQNGVKAIFTDRDLAVKMSAKGMRFSSANSINWGRLAPQIVYYFSAYADLLATGNIKPGEKINFVVPTGNFGNILAAYYACRIGLPVNKLICASNENKVLTEFVKTGTYDRNRKFKMTISPSMDILISSNLERLLFEVNGHNSDKVDRWMKSLKDEGIYKVDDETRNKISSLFWAEYSNEKETLETINNVYEEYKYLLDTHTAVGIDVYDKYVIATGDMTKTVAVSTASPFKFNRSVARAILGREQAEKSTEFDLLEVLSKKCGMAIPPGLKNLDKRPVMHTRVTDKEGMKKATGEILDL